MKKYYISSPSKLNNHFDVYKEVHEFFIVNRREAKFYSPRKNKWIVTNKDFIENKYWDYRKVSKTDFEEEFILRAI